MNYVACIFARGGSKGLPGKNIKSFHGKPLIAWSIEHALSVARISRVIVSTDCDEIAQISRQYGAEVPFKRPSELAGDKSSEWLAWRHTLEFIAEKNGAFPDAMISLPATSPLRCAQDIENCLDEFERDNSIDGVVTVTDAHRSPYFNMIRKNETGDVSLVIPPQDHVSRRQDAPEVFDMTTVAYVVKPKFVMDSENLFCGKLRSIHVPLERAVDIDTHLDFKIAEVIYQERLDSKNNDNGS